ncbi:hypothetical protein PHMEG_00028075 [Phytophthora megakarya]|uniref:Polyprotein n=1 Tax=Phytophthora megakarya TaxID=4795 RepID=A0A225V6F2_9STRA|nr:hypothetical protein PHMEG_00028075 [Phytophthora megakarya]
MPKVSKRKTSDDEEMKAGDSGSHGALDAHRIDTVRALRFDGKNFLAYKEGLKAALKARKCSKVLIGIETKPERDGSPEASRRRKRWKEKVLQLNDILTNTLDDGTRVRLAHLETPQAKWSALVEDFEKKSFAVALFKRRELLNVEFESDNESIRDYIHHVEAIRQELTLMGEEVSAREVITALLTGLGDKYESMIESFDSLDDYTLQQVKVKLTSREERMKQAKAVSDAKIAGNGRVVPEVEKVKVDNKSDIVGTFNVGTARSGGITNATVLLLNVINKKVECMAKARRLPGDDEIVTTHTRTFQVTTIHMRRNLKASQ